MFSKRSAYVSVAVLAAISVGVGCADGSRKPSQRKTIAAQSQKTEMVPRKNADGSIMMGKDGKPMMERVPVKNPNAPQTGSTTTSTTGVPQVGPDGKTIIKDIKVVKEDKGLEEIATQEKQMISGSSVTRDELAAGKYELKSVVTSVLIDSGVAGEKVRAIRGSSVISTSSRGFTLESKNNINTAGMLTNFSDSGRTVNIPATFPVTLTGGKWTPDSTAASRMAFTNKVEMEKSASGKVTMTDQLANEQSGLRASVLDILTNGTLQSDKAYKVEDGGSVIYLRLLQKSTSELTVYMAIEEQRKEPNGQVNFDRYLFFTYAVTAEAKTAATLNPDDISIKSSTSGDPLN